MSKGLAIIMYSGEAEKFIPLGVFAQTAANLGIPVKIFVTGFALLQFLKEKPELRFSKEFEEFVPKIHEGMQKIKAPSWYDMVMDAKDIGDVKVYVCSLMAQIVGVSKDDMDPIVDDVVGATFFLKEVAADYEVIFI